MIARRFGRVVNITSSAVKAPIDVLALSNGARSGLTGFVAGLARKVAEHNVTINNLLPGLFDTDRIATTLAAAAQAQGATVDEPARGARRKFRRSASARRTSSARRARSSAVSMRATSPGRTGCSTAARIPAHFETDFETDLNLAGAARKVAGRHVRAPAAGGRGTARA